MVKLNFEHAAHAEHFYHRYITWCNSLYEDYDLDKSPVVDECATGIPVISWWNLDLIKSTDSKIIFVDSVLEGANIFEQALTKQTLDQYPSDKHYVFLSNGNFSQVDFPMSYTYDVIQIQYVLHMLPMIANDTTTYGYCYHDTSNWISEEKPFLFYSIIGQRRSERNAFIREVKKHFKPDQYIMKYDGELLTHTFKNTYLQHPYQSMNAKNDSLPGLQRVAVHRMSYNVTRQCHFNFFVDTCPLSRDNFGFISAHPGHSFIDQKPFVVVGAPGMLRDCHKAGFRTWSELWDESYDQEPDFHKRLDMCMQVAKSLQSFDWAGNKQKLQEIANHNVLNVIASHKTSIKEFERFEKCIRSLAERNLLC